MAVVRIDLEINSKGEPVIKAIAGGLEQTAVASDRAKASLGGFSSILQGIGQGLGQGLFNNIAAGLREFTTGALDAQSKSEAAINSLNLALANQGNLVGNTSQHLQEYAAALQAASTFDDELIVGVEAMLASFGMTEDQIIATTQAAADFAAATGKDLNTAAESLAKAYTGNTTALQKMGFQFEAGSTSAQKFQQAMDQVNQRFGGAAAAATETYAGRMAQLKNAFGDAQEALGKFLGFMLSNGEKPFDLMMGAAQRLQVFLGRDLIVALSEFQARYLEMMAKIVEGVNTKGGAGDTATMFGPLSFLNSLKVDNSKELADSLRAQAAEIRATGDAAAAASGKTIQFANGEKHLGDAAGMTTQQLKAHQQALAQITDILQGRLDHELAYAAQNMKDLGEAAKEADLSNLILDWQDWATTAEDVARVIPYLVDTVDMSEASMERLDAATRAAAEAAEAFKKHWNGIADGFRDLSQTLGVASDLMAQLGVTADSTASHVVHDFGTMAQAAGTLAAGIASGNGLQVLQGLMQGAGALVSLVGDLFGGPSQAERDALIIGHVIGHGVSSGIQEAIRADAVRLGTGLTQATLLNLPDIMRESGGNLANYRVQIEALLSGIMNHSIPAREGVQALSDSFQMLADDAGGAGGVATAAMERIMERVEAAHLRVASVQKYVTDQATASGAALTTLFDNITEDSAHATESMDLFATTLQGDFAKMRKEGIGFQQIFKALGPAIDSAVAAFDRLHMVMPDSLAQLAGLRDVVAANGPLFDGIDALQTILKTDLSLGMAAGAEGARILAEGAATARDQFAGLTAAGLTADQALVAMGPTLGLLHDMAERLHQPLDEATQALYDQANAAGDIPVDPMNALVNATERMVHVLELLALRLGVARQELERFNNTGPPSSGPPNGPPPPPPPPPPTGGEGAGGLYVPNVPRGPGPGGMSYYGAHPGESLLITKQGQGLPGGRASFTYAPQVAIDARGSSLSRRDITDAVSEGLRRKDAELRRLIIELVQDQARL